ncbi:DUF4198 domain-containing protein [Sulfitobacter sp. G21635-S1]|jgi:hypothetical protein|uniref:DUF4198 domain-containing protein n=1 Tax=Sulfitobacter sp. G21635-S1 TaxID=3014043 RepID=UPI0022AED692|nr:DUF4198 domain-containing protein [Sulfitobacter sp. G21635-S1]MCZ4254963.1 DUF4198 domain-containing protein [Sulfitobacter sp. G21635-S1]
MYLSRLFLLVTLGAVPLSPALSHEFWIEPHDYQVDNGGTVVGDFKNGQEFVGNTLSFFDKSTERYAMVADGVRTPLKPRAGDRPALNIPAPIDDGLLVVVHETTPQYVTYTDWDKFVKFTKHKDFRDAVALHEQRGWSKERLRERYTRHVKALIAVGSGAGADQAVGMATEFTALTNPYDPGFDGTMQVSLTYDGAPRADAQVEVFDRAPDDSVTITLHRTDTEGLAEIPVTPGHAYLFDAVTLREAADAGETENAPVWETLWAALTFEVPQ